MSNAWVFPNLDLDHDKYKELTTCDGLNSSDVNSLDLQDVVTRIKQLGDSFIER